MLPAPVTTHARIEGLSAVLLSNVASEKEKRDAKGRIIRCSGEEGRGARRFFHAAWSVTKSGDSDSGRRMLL